MKALRVIKIICFVLALICCAVAVAGDVFIIRDTYKYDVEANEVKEALDLHEFDFKSIFSFSAKAEGEDDAIGDWDAAGSTDEFTQPETVAEEPTAPDTQSAADDTTIEGSVSSEGNDAGADNGDSKTEDTTSEDEYTLDKHCGAILSLMEAGASQMKPIELDCKCDNDVADMFLSFVRSASRCFGFNYCMLAAYGLLTVAFILHLISRKRKSVWGTLQMIFGYLLFLIFSFVGYMIVGNFDWLRNSWEELEVVIDPYAFRIYAFASQAILGFIFGYGFYRAGVRHGQIKYLKKRLSKKRNH